MLKIIYRLAIKNKTLNDVAKRELSQQVLLESHISDKIKRKLVRFSSYDQPYH